MGYSDLKFKANSVFLVTGGAGFIGSNICEALINMGCSVRCLDNLSEGKIENISMFLNNRKFEFVEGDIRNTQTCMEVCKNVDYVLHQAAWGSVPRSIEMPVLYDEINIHGTLNMMEAAVKNNVKKFVYASSSAVYGEGDNDCVEGNENVTLSPYALTKKVNEEYAMLYSNLYGLDTYGLRYFNVFGKNQDPKGAYAAVIPKFITMLYNGEAPTIDGDGTQTRDFTYIDNVIEANLKACLAGREAAGEAYNVAYGERKNIIDMYNDLCAALGVSIEPCFGAERQGDIKKSVANISKAKKKLGYNPSISFAEGIKLTIDWYKHNITV